MYRFNVQLSIKFALLLRTYSCSRHGVPYEGFPSWTTGSEFLEKSSLRDLSRQERLWCWTKKVFAEWTVHTKQSTTNFYNRTHTAVTSSKRCSTVPELTPNYQWLGLLKHKRFGLKPFLINSNLFYSIELKPAMDTTVPIGLVIWCENWNWVLMPVQAPTHRLALLNTIG